MSLRQDLRFATRMLLKKPGFTAVAVLTLALGIGANTAIFSVVDSVVFRSLPYPQPQRLVQLYTQFLTTQFDRFWWSPPEFLELRQKAQSFQSVAAWNVQDTAIVGGKEPVRISTAVTGGDFFETLGVAPILGQVYGSAASTPGAPAVGVLGHGLWQSAFGGDEKILGRTVQIDGVATQIVAVMPQSYDFPDRSVELWLPLTLDPARTDNRSSHWLSVVARLKEGVSETMARAELDTLMAQSEELHKDHPQSRNRHPMVLYSLQEELIGSARPGMLMLLGSVGFVLLIACANVANLLLARAAGRAKEIAVRAALGAGRGRLMRQFLVESLLLGLLGGLLGLLLARWGLDLILNLHPDSIPRVQEIGIDARVLAFTLGLSALTGLAFGLAPALHLKADDLHAILKSGTRGTTEGGERQRFRKALVVTEVALAVILVVGSGLMLRSFWSLLQVQPGFRPQGLVTMEIALDEAQYPEAQKVLDFYGKLQDGLKSLPGVENATLISGLPPSRRINANDISLVGLEEPKPGGPLPAWNVDYWQIVADDFGPTLGAQLVDGRWLESADREGAAGVVLINETMAKRFWPGQNALGRQLHVTPWNKEAPPQTIVGIVADVKQQGLGAVTGTEVFIPMRQMPQLVDGPERYLNIVVRASSGDPIQLVPAIRALIRGLDANVPIAHIRTMDQVFRDSVAQPWFLTILLAAFAGVALALAAIGIYGLLSFAVAQRTNEIGIRMALGAQRKDVLRMIIGQGMGLVVVGLAIGMLASAGLSRWIRSLLFSVSPTDPMTFAAVPLLLAAIALLACIVPAWRALKVDPMVALRYE